MKTRLLLGSALLAMSCANEPKILSAEEQAIVNGELAAVGQFPAVGMLFFGGSLCTGTLISPTFVITASHCTIGQQASQTTFNIGNGPFGNFDKTVAAKKLFTHPKFISQGGLPQFFLGNDVALVELKEPIDDVVPIPFNTDRLEDVTTPGGFGFNIADCDTTKNCFTAVGFGDTVGSSGDAGTKRFVNIILESLSPEHINFGDGNHGGDGPNGNGDGNTCQGDSGGPSLMTINGELRVIAVTSGGAGGCLGDSFSQRTDSDFEEFIDPIVNGGLIPDPENCLADDVCDDACGITDPDCTCQADGFCQPPSQCRGVNDVDPDCPTNNNTGGEEAGCAVSPTSSDAPLGLAAGLFVLAFASLGLRRRRNS